MSLANHTTDYRHGFSQSSSGSHPSGNNIQTPAGNITAPFQDVDELNVAITSDDPLDAEMRLSSLYRQVDVLTTTMSRDLVHLGGSAKVWHEGGLDGQVPLSAEAMLTLITRVQHTWYHMCHILSKIEHLNSRPINPSIVAQYNTFYQVVAYLKNDVVSTELIEKRVDTPLSNTGLVADDRDRGVFVGLTLLNACLGTNPQGLLSSDLFQLIRRALVVVVCLDPTFLAESMNEDMSRRIQEWVLFSEDSVLTPLASISAVPLLGAEVSAFLLSAGKVLFTRIAQSELDTHYGFDHVRTRALSPAASRSIYKLMKLSEPQLDICRIRLVRSLPNQPCHATGIVITSPATDNILVADEMSEEGIPSPKKRKREDEEATSPVAETHQINKQEVCIPPAALPPLKSPEPAPLLKPAIPNVHPLHLACHLVDAHKEEQVTLENFTSLIDSYPALKKQHFTPTFGRGNMIADKFKTLTKPRKTIVYFVKHGTNKSALVGLTTASHWQDLVIETKEAMSALDQQHALWVKWNQEHPQ
jgi:hypothetical protein